MMYLATTIEENLGLDEIENPTLIEELIASFDWRNLAQQAIKLGIRILFTLFIFLLSIASENGPLKQVLINMLKN